ncbi:MAG: sulfatase [Candidatus Hydrogenedentota bacterium]
MNTLATRREFLAGSLAAFGAVGLGVHGTAEPARQPNFVIIFTDDQGYNDVGCFGSHRIKTPRLDQMALEGMRFTDFYSAAPVCTPSRAGLLTGCYPQRNSMVDMPRSENRIGQVLFPDTPCGIHPDEVTLAEALKGMGYATGCVGKWHLGHLPPFLPTRNGFDSYFGIPYSNDMIPCPLMRGEEVIEEPAVQATLTERYTEESIQFIRENKDKPFFLYLAHNMPHIPLHISDRFAGKSDGGIYGDVIECIDWSTGAILDTLDELGLSDDTIVVFTTDNGPWLSKGSNGGFATPLRAGKGTTYEGGMRVPCIMRWNGHIPAGSVCREVAATIDLFPTFTKLAGRTAPPDRTIDGLDIYPLMSGDRNATSPHEAYFYYFGSELHAVRSGEWKLRFENSMKGEDIYRKSPNPDALVLEALYHLPTDPGEQKNLIDQNPDIVDRLRRQADRMRTELGDSKTGIAGRSIRPIGMYAPNPVHS